RTTRNSVFRGFFWNQLSCRFRLLFILIVPSAQVHLQERPGISAVIPREAVFPTFFSPQFIRFAHTYVIYDRARSSPKAPPDHETRQPLPRLGIRWPPPALNGPPASPDLTASSGNSPISSAPAGSGTPCSPSSSSIWPGTAPPPTASSCWPWGWAASCC